MHASRLKDDDKLPNSVRFAVHADKDYDGPPAVLNCPGLPCQGSILPDVKGSSRMVTRLETYPVRGYPTLWVVTAHLK